MSKVIPQTGAYFNRSSLLIMITSASVSVDKSIKKTLRWWLCDDDKNSREQKKKTMMTQKEHHKLDTVKGRRVSWSILNFGAKRKYIFYRK